VKFAGKLERNEKLKALSPVMQTIVYPLDRVEGNISEKIIQVQTDITTAYHTFDEKEKENLK